MNDEPMILEQPTREPEAVAREQEWGRRGEQLREQEWETAQKLIQVATALLQRVRKRTDQEASLTEISRMLDLASRLGRLATGLQTEKTETTGRVDVSFRVELEAALKKVYGESVPATAPAPVIDITPQAPLPTNSVVQGGASVPASRPVTGGVSDSL